MPLQCFRSLFFDFKRTSILLFAMSCLFAGISGCKRNNVSTSGSEPQAKSPPTSGPLNLPAPVLAPLGHWSASEASSTVKI